MNLLVRNLLLSRPVLIGGAVIVGAREFVALSAAPLKRSRRVALRAAARNDETQAAA